MTIMRTVDLNNDDQIHFPEFAEMLRQNPVFLLMRFDYTYTLNLSCIQLDCIHRNREIYIKSYVMKRKMELGGGGGGETEVVLSRVIDFVLDFLLETPLNISCCICDWRTC